MLQANTTDTGASATKPVSVSVTFLSEGVSTNLSFTNPTKTSWTGEMWQQDFQNIPDGVYTFRFTVTYSNGVVKADDVSIIISGTIYDYFLFHRIK